MTGPKHVYEVGKSYKTIKGNCVHIISSRDVTEDGRKVYGNDGVWRRDADGTVDKGDWNLHHPLNLLPVRQFTPSPRLELLELAAKAAGYELVYNETYGTFDAYRGERLVKFNWDPEGDDGHALCLAVAVVAHGATYGEDELIQDEARAAATRRAIFMGAVEKGRAIGGGVSNAN